MSEATGIGAGGAIRPPVEEAKPAKEEGTYLFP